MNTASFEGEKPINEPVGIPKITSTTEVVVTGAQKSESEIDIESYREHAQIFLDRYSRTGFLASFSGDTSIHFKLGNAFYFDFQKGEVNLATDWFYKKGFSERQILWACMHEIGHFEDFKHDPERLIKNFDYIAEQARQTGDTMLRKWEAVLDQTDPKQKVFLDSLKQTKPANPKRPEMGSFNKLAEKAYGIHHPFFNCMDDIWVNNTVARKAASFERGTDGGKEIESLYKEKLFPSVDYSKKDSRHRQFIYKLLRDDNVPDEECIVSPDAEEALSRKIVFGGKSYTAKEIIATFIKPRTGRNTKAGDRYTILKRTIEPIFKELLAKDLDEWKPEWKPPEEQQSKKGGGQPQKSQNESGQEESAKQDQSQESDEQQESNSQQELTPFDKEIGDWDENNLDQLPPEFVKEVFDKYEEVKEKREEVEKKEEETRHHEEEKVKSEDAKTAKEKSADVQKQQDEQWAEKNASGSRGSSKEQLLADLARFRQIQAEIAPYLDELSALWRHIIFGSSREIVRGMEGHFKTGDELDVQKTVEDWGSIQEGKFEQTKIFRKISDREVVTRKPERIRVRIAGDMSGSMNERTDGGRKIRTLQQAMTLIFASIDEFQTYLNSTRSETKSKLQTETEGWIFDNSARKIKSFEDNENLEMVSIFSHIRNPGGSTRDDVVLSDILRSITPEDEEGIRSGKIMDIVFEITDGGSDDEGSTKEVVDRLVEKGVIARAFQIGVVDEYERNTFDAVWNDGREKSFGENVGVNISALIPAITKALKEYLGNVSI